MRHLRHLTESLLLVLYAIVQELILVVECDHLVIEVNRLLIQILRLLGNLQQLLVVIHRLELAKELFLHLRIEGFIVVT